MVNAKNAENKHPEGPQNEGQPLGEELGTEKEAPKAEAPPVQVPIDAAELERLRKDAWEYKDKSLRLLAEMENSRKRLQKEKQDLTQYAVQNVIVDFLHPIDHLENALNFTQNMTGEVKNWALGFQMILSQFKEVLVSNGVVAFKSEGTPFDPHCHEAVEMIETNEFPPGTVISESVRGYKMGERVIRPARVKVAKAPVAETKLEEKQTKESNQ